MTSPHLLRKRNRKSLSGRAFTLVEVVLALGVVSFGLISMLGLLTVGLKTFHDAMSQTTETEIAQQISNQLQLANFSSISGIKNSSNYYFTQEGLQLTNGSSTSTAPASTVYTASVAAPSVLAVPGVTSSTSSLATNTMTFVISIWSVNSPQTTNAFAIQIANNGN
jgi:uncharacterized protein (TIGR02598 family)